MNPNTGEVTPITLDDERRAAAQVDLERVAPMAGELGRRALEPGDRLPDGRVVVGPAVATMAADAERWRRHRRARKAQRKAARASRRRNRG